MCGTERSGGKRGKRSAGFGWQREALISSQVMIKGLNPKLVARFNNGSKYEWLPQDVAIRSKFSVAEFIGLGGPKSSNQIR